MKHLTLALIAALPLTAGAADDAPRRVEIQVTAEGYKPSKIKAKPGENLILVFKPTDDMGCCDAITVPAIKWSGRVEKGGKPVEVPAKVPATGKLTFACSMNMCKGEVAP